MEATELAEYFRALNDAGCDVLVIDGSPAQIFQQHHEAWHSLSRHEEVDRSSGHDYDHNPHPHPGEDTGPSISRLTPQ